MSHRLERTCLAATLLAALCGAACGQISSDQPGVQPIGGGPNAGGGARNAGGGGSAGAIGGTGPGPNSDAGAAGEGGGAPRRVPGETEEEADVLELLFDEAQIDSSRGEALARLAATIGLARGYAVCRCGFPANALPANPIDLVKECAPDESGNLGRLTQDDGVRCLSEALLANPALEETLRCSIREHMQDGRAWLDVCWQERQDNEPGIPPPRAPAICLHDELDSIFYGCTLAHYCPDGRLVADGRCDEVVDCESATDEHACFEQYGRDMVRCGDEVRRSYSICLPDVCPALASHCVADNLGSFLCDDGTVVSTYVVCDRVDDCSDHADERYCLR